MTSLSDRSGEYRQRAAERHQDEVELAFKCTCRQIVEEHKPSLRLPGREYFRLRRTLSLFSDPLLCIRVTLLVAEGTSAGIMLTSSDGVGDADNGVFVAGVGGRLMG